MRPFKLLFPIALGICATVLAQTPLATATAAVTRNTSYPPVGLASTETMQVNVVNLASNPTTVTTTTPAASCTGNISFFNAAGTPVGTATTFTVTEGQISSATLTFAKAAIAGTRGEIRAVIQTATPTGRNAPACSLESSLETFDSVSGATHVYLSTPASPASGPTTIVISGIGPNQ
jgi:hypothetical protein